MIWAQCPWRCCIPARRHEVLSVFIRICSIIAQHWESPFSYSLWHSRALISTIAHFAISLNCARMFVMSTWSGSCLPHCGLPFVLHSGFSPPWAQVSTFIFGDLNWVCLCKEVIGFPHWFLTPVLTSTITPSLAQRRCELCLWAKELARVNWQVRVRR